jgi:hypothetical protein
MHLDWDTFNTALILAMLGYVWRQGRIVDQLKQAILGVEGHGGALDEIRMLRQRSHELANQMVKLGSQIEILASTLEQRARRREPKSPEG